MIMNIVMDIHLVRTTMSMVRTSGDSWLDWGGGRGVNDGVCTFRPIHCFALHAHDMGEGVGGVENNKHNEGQWSSISRRKIETYYVIGFLYLRTSDDWITRYANSFTRAMMRRKLSITRNGALP